MERLDKLLSSRTGLSRKDAKALIKSGGVLINGVKADSGEQKLAETDSVTINGQSLDMERHVYYMMNKPAGILSVTYDPECETVIDLLPPEMRRKGLFPAGRLDKDTRGFVFITDDGEFAHRILSPKSHVPKTYFARLDAKIPPEAAGIFAQGIDIGGGDVCSPAKLDIAENGNEAVLVIYEGMYHQVKRMFKKLSLEVVYLERIAIGGLKLDGSLPPGGVRKISQSEIELIIRT